jgi:hypothetical protein
MASMREVTVCFRRAASRLTCRVSASSRRTVVRTYLLPLLLVGIAAAYAIVYLQSIRNYFV